MSAAKKLAEEEGTVDEEDSENNLTSYDFIRNVSLLISNEYAEAYLYCHLTVVDGYIFYLSEDAKYETWLDYF